ncbi:MAG TPA: histidine kinase [Longimicrobiales bacterium]
MRSVARARYAWLILATCTLLTLLESAHTFLVAREHGVMVPIPALLVRHLPPWSALALLTPAIGWAALRLPVYGAGPWRAISAHGCASAVFPFVHVAFADGIRYVLAGGAANAGTPISSGGYVFGVLLYWLVAGAHTMYALHRRHARDLAEAAALRQAAVRLEGSLMDANLQALRWQLNPHFLFNALNSVSILAEREGAWRVVQVIGKLSVLLRGALEQRGVTTTLAEEIDFVTRYLEFERERFEDRLDFEWRVALDCRHAQVPALVLQPLVENAIKHGVDPSSGRATVVIGAVRAGGRLRLWVADGGPGLRSSASGREGVGLRNTRDRLRQLFGENYTLRLDPAPAGGVTATVVIPWQNGAAPALQEALR